MTSRRKIRIFISSPGDVQQEREIAKKVINAINDVYSNYVLIEVVMWEDLPLTVHTTFQEGINYFLNKAPIDIAIFILWSRLGTPLSMQFFKSDGSVYNSGTEYEFDLMMRLYEQTGSPRIMTYIKSDKIRLKEGASLDDLIEVKNQENLLRNFIYEHFRDEKTNSNYAYLQYRGSASFENKLRTHIIGMLKSIIVDIENVQEWEGNPYVGLQSFEFEQEKVFYGRKQLIYDTVEKLIDYKGEYSSNLIVLGESGSGKSSFIKAGLIPLLCKDKKGYTSVTPSMFRGNVYSGLLDILACQFNFLVNNPFYEELKEDINEQSNFKHLLYAFNNNSHQKHILFIDQFEELFNDSSISNEERKKALLLIRGIISTKKMMVIISMRSDFYNLFSLYAELAQIKENCIVIDMPVVGLPEITEIIEEPAKKACLKWEIDHLGNSLNKIIAHDAVQLKNLPLIEFALSELYASRNNNNVITYEAYNSIGGLKGAIVTYANKFWSSLSQDEQDSVYSLLGFLVSVSTAHNNVYVRKVCAVQDLLQNNMANELISKLVNSHLFTSGIDAKGNATITIAHEILINSWDVIAQWVKIEEKFLIKNTYYEHLTYHWKESRQDDTDLISGRTPILEAEYHLFRNKQKISGDIQFYIKTSIKKDLRKGLLWRFIVLFIMVFYVINDSSLEVLSKFGLYIPQFKEDSVLYFWERFLLWYCIFSPLWISTWSKVAGKPCFIMNKYYIMFHGISASISIGYSLLYAKDNIVLSLILIMYSVIPLIICTAEGIRRKIWKRKFMSYLIPDAMVSSFYSIASMFGNVISWGIIGYFMLHINEMIEMLFRSTR